MAVLNIVSRLDRMSRPLIIPLSAATKVTMMTAVAGLPRSSSAYAIAHRGVTSPPYPNRIQNDGRVSPMSRSRANMPNARQSVTWFGWAASDSASVVDKAAASMAITTMKAGGPQVDLGSSE